MAVEVAANAMQGKCIVIGIGVQKGGTGKTTTTGIFAHLLSMLGYRVLVVDLDSQGNLTEFVTGVDDIYIFQKQTIYEAMQNYDASNFIVKNVRDSGIDLIPAEDFLSFFPAWLYTKHSASKTRIPNRLVLRTTLEKVKPYYDFILMDFAPNLGDVVQNGMAAADYLIIPAECGRWCYHAIDRYIEMAEHIQGEMKQNCGVDASKPIAIIRSILNLKLNNDSYYHDKIAESFSQLTLNSLINERAKVKEFAVCGVSTRTVDERDALTMYSNALQEVLTRVREDQQRTK